MPNKGEIKAMQRLRITRRTFPPAPRRITPKHFEDRHTKDLLRRPSPFHPYGLRSLITSIAFALVPHLTTGCQSPPDPQPIRECFDRYKEALLNKRGEEAVDLIDSSTLRYYASMKDAALNAKQQEVRNMTLVDKLNVLGFRHQIGAGQLQRLSERELFVSLVDQGWVVPEGFADSGLGQINISGDTADGEFLSGGQGTQFKFRFVKEGGVWRMDLTAQLSTVDQAMRAVFLQTDMREATFIDRMLEKVSGNPVTKDIWEPLVKE